MPTRTAERIFYKKTRTKAVVKLVREQYLRTDIPCLVESCSECPAILGNGPHLDTHASHYIIPDISVIVRYLEILEQDILTGILISQTVIALLLQRDKTKTYKRLRDVVGDTRRKSIVFYNETFTETKVHRLPGEQRRHRDWRALCTLATWYGKHLHGTKDLILLSENFTRSDVTVESPNIKVMTVKDYLETYWPQHTDLHHLADALTDVVLEEDVDEEIGSKNKAKAVQGFREYLPTAELEAGIKSGRFLSGALACRSGGGDEAFIRAGSKTVYIVGSENRNRAVCGDTVVVQLLSEGQFQDGHDMTHEYESEKFSPAPQGSDPHKPTGRVVGVLNRNWRPYVATLPKQSQALGGFHHLAIPLDPVIPKIRIRHPDPQRIEDQRIVVRIDSWPVTSQYPNGHYVRTLGPIHDLNTEVSAILVEHGISVSQASQAFGEALLKELPMDTPNLPWKPSEDELARRRDLRQLTVFSIDPPNCQDIDDALSIRELDDGKLELGVHIADVSYFVKEQSLTDLEARSRGTTVYFADRRFDMLPSVLSERVCSLRQDVDRYAVSVLWTLDEQGIPIDTWFGRTVIRSCCEMEYSQAQQLLDDGPVPKDLDPALGKRLSKSIHLLAKVLRKIRSERLSRGALELDSIEVKFDVTNDKRVAGIQLKSDKEIHHLVAEAMILANTSVGKRIYQGNQLAAILRHHPPPGIEKFTRLIEMAESKGFSVDVSSNLAFARSLVSMAEQCQQEPEIIQLVKGMATRAMNEAAYISAGHFAVDQYHHYGLALDFYTHFTSPIRRYADVIAHRQLLQCCNDAVECKEAAKGTVVTDDAKVEDICDHLNKKSRESKLAQRDSDELFQSLYVMQHSSLEQPLVEDGIISEIRTHGFHVYIPRLGIKGVVVLVKDDKTTVLPSMLGLPSTTDVQTLSCHTQANLPASITLNVGDQPPLVFSLFDRVRIALTSIPSHAHRRQISMTLVGMLDQPTFQTTPTKVSNASLMASIVAKQQEHDAENQGVVTSTPRKKPVHPTSMYHILEQFRKLSLIETTTRDI